MERATIVLITLIAYKFVLLGIGLWAQRRTRDASDYFLGGRQLGAVVASISYAASSSSAWTLLGVSGAAFSMGLGAVWLLPGIVLCHVVAWFWIAPALRRMADQRDCITLTDVIAPRGGGQGRAAVVAVASLIILFCFMFYVAAQFQGAGNTFAANFSISRNESIWIGGAVVLVYTLLGGFWAVSVTDALQGLLMCIASVLLPIAAVMAVGGPDALVAGLRLVSTPDQLSWTSEHVGIMGLGFVLGMMLIGLGTFGQPQLLNRFMALKDDQALRRARIIAISWFLVVLAGMLVTGWCGHLLMAEAADGESLFFQLTSELFPPLLGGIITAAVLSAIMSTADSQLLVAASSVAYDMGLFKGHPERALLVSRITIALLCGIAVAIAIALPASIFSRVLFAWNGLGAAFGPIVMGRILGRKIQTWALLSAMLAGFGLTAVIYSLPNTPGDIAERVIPFVTAGLIVWIGSSRRTSGRG
ncbi:MAG: sodium/proline symporter [Xanthomonadales bacterium]|nr:sodium/proline symporter [Xanthomonadales bacterium]